MKFIWAILLLFTSTHVQAQDSTSRFEFEEKHMGTLFRIVFYAPDESTANKAKTAAFDRITFLNRTMSDYDPSSELMQLCKKFEKTICEPVTVSKELFFVLSKAKEISELSEGSFDVTIGPIVQLWRIARRTQRLPDEEKRKAALAKVGYTKIELDANKETVKLLTPGMQLDLGGIAKGYAADEVLQTLKSFQIYNALVAAGGDITCMGSPPGKDYWEVEIDPVIGSKTRRTLKLKDAAVSTSGDKENFVVIDGTRYSHIVHPKTGLGLQRQPNVTIIARQGIYADSLTKMASIFPPEKAIQAIQKIPNSEVLIVFPPSEKGEEIHKSKGFDAFLIDKK